VTMTMAKTLTALAAILSLPAAALAQDEGGFPATPPAPAEPRGFDLPDTETYTLRNGMKVTLVPYGNVPKVLVRAVTRVGNLNDGEQTYIADLTAEMMSQGAGGLDAAGVASKAADMGGELSISVGLDQTSVSRDVLS
jgi:zinc protease